MASVYRGDEITSGGSKIMLEGQLVSNNTTAGTKTYQSNGCLLRAALFLCTSREDCLADFFVFSRRGLSAY